MHSPLAAIPPTHFRRSLPPPGQESPDRRSAPTCFAAQAPMPAGTPSGHPFAGRPYPVPAPCVSAGLPKRRAAIVLFCLTPFLLAHFIAPLRPLLRDQLLGSYHVPLARWPWTAWIYGSEAAARGRELARLEIAARQSGEATLHIKLAEWQVGDSDYGLHRLRADETLLRRYPNVAWLAADYLRLSALPRFGTRHREVPEMMSSGKSPAHPPPKVKKSSKQRGVGEFWSRTTLFSIGC